MNDGARLASAAEDLVGVPFRLHGRDPATGLDCIGMVHAALVSIGCAPPVLPAYAMRNIEVPRFFALLPTLGFTVAADAVEPGDLFLLRPSAAQFHLGIASHDGWLIHAHGGLGRVVASPPPFTWPVAARWRLNP